MIEKTRKYSVADLYAEAAKMVREEFGAMKKKPLTEPEEKNIAELAKTISKSVLKEMKVA